MPVEKLQAQSKAGVNRKKKRRRKPRLTGLSKQRQTANARERSRMRSISAAMLELRYHLPSSFAPKEKKLSKIQTLRFAIRYIGDLFEVLQKGQESDSETSSVESESNTVREGRFKADSYDRRQRFKIERDNPSCMYLKEALSQTYL